MSFNFIAEAGVSRTGQGFSVDPSNVIILPEISGRIDNTDVSGLVEDIRTNKQLQPCLIWRNKDGWPVLAAGHRRLRALVEINKTLKPGEEKRRLNFNHIPAKTEAESFCYTIRENRNRLNPSLLDDAHNMFILQDRFSKSDEEVARIYNPDISTPEELAKGIREIKKCLSLLNLSPEAQEEYRSGYMTTSAAVVLSKIASENEQNKVVAKAKKEGKKKLQVSQVQEARAAKKRVIDPDILLERAIKKDNLRDRISDLEELAEFGAGIAAEILSETRSEDTLLDLAREFTRFCSQYKITLPVELTRYA